MPSVFSTTFKNHTSKKIPKVLYHYTTQSGLIGILKSEQLWATKVQHMDDLTEFRLAVRVALAQIEVRQKNETDSSKKEKLNSLRDVNGNPNVNVFVACFCEQGDLLSQWRGYSGGNHGFSIGIDSNSLKKKTSPDGFTFARCIYDKKTQTQIVDDGITEALKIEEDHRSIYFDGFLSRVGAFFKHSLFKEEREWRLVSQTTSIKHKDVGFRPGRSMINPYLSISLGSGKDSVVNRVTVGPCPHPELSNGAVEMLLLHKGVHVKGKPWELDVRDSKIPYRNW